jgi:hypothetical protein
MVAPGSLIAWQAIDRFARVSATGKPTRSYSPDALLLARWVANHRDGISVRRTATALEWYPAKVGAVAVRLVEHHLITSRPMRCESCAHLGRDRRLRLTRAGSVFVRMIDKRGAV